MELPHFNTDEGVNIVSGVEFFKPGTCGNTQVPDYPTFLLQYNTILITVEPRSIVPAAIVFPHVLFAIFGPELSSI